jgi:hypothetical protein
VSCENGPVVFRQVLSKLLDFCDCGHGAIIIGSLVEASEQRTPFDRSFKRETKRVNIQLAHGFNNLAPKQTLTFESKGLTLVYGDNGARKDYTRILRCLGRLGKPFVHFFLVGEQL